MVLHHLKHVKSGEYTRILILRTVGNFLIFSSLFLIAKTFSQPVYQEFKYFLDHSIAKKYIVASNKAQADQQVQRIEIEQPIEKGGLAKALNLKKVEALVPEDPNYSVVIPAIGANARIVPNVDASNEEEYLSALKQGVAHALGTAFPGENGHIFLFAHSTDYIWNVGTYNAVFYLLYKLQKGDEIFLFYKGQRYAYRVFDKKIVDPSQVEYLTRKTNKEFLTLQTCWPPGTALKRQLIFAAREAL